MGPSDRILGFGCGTGTFAQARERLGGAANLKGLDARPERIADAREQAPELSWHERKARNSSFSGASFELVVGQQMLEFIPDRSAALREIRRVLVRDGRLLLATWRPRHELPPYEVLGQVAERHLGTPNEQRFALGDDGELCTSLADAGCSDVRVEIVSRAESLRTFPIRLGALAAKSRSLGAVRRRAGASPSERRVREYRSKQIVRGGRKDRSSLPRRHRHRRREARSRPMTERDPRSLLDQSRSFKDDPRWERAYGRYRCYRRELE